MSVASEALAPCVAADRRWLILAAAAVASFLVLLDDTAVAIALPSIGRELDLGLSSEWWGSRWASR
jgi:hypothetical protein